MIATGLFTIAFPLFALLVVPLFYIVKWIIEFLQEWHYDCEFYRIKQKLEEHPNYKPTSYEKSVCRAHGYLPNFRCYAKEE